MSEDPARLQLLTLGTLGHALPQRARVLDFGCGDGAMVEGLRSLGCDAFGCDIVVAQPTGRIRLIESPYRLPFEDASFDFVCSDQVLEHVQDHHAAFREIARVLRPTGTTLHWYPARLRPREVHTHVPLGGLIRSTRWYRAWARAGIRNEFQQDMDATETVRRNEEFMRERTNYISARRMRRLAASHLGEARFVEQAYLETTVARGRRLRVGGAVPPGAAWLYRHLRGRVLFTVMDPSRRAPPRGSG